MDSAIVKLNEGVSGEGNALVRLRGLPAPGSPTERDEVMKRLRAMELESPDDRPSTSTSPSSPSAAGSSRSGSSGEELRSPSVQLRVLPGGEVELLSTHDQLLGGASGQSYLGCVFPAAPEYARLITEHAAAIGQRLASEGRSGGSRSTSSSSASSDGGWTPYAIELNLRKGGTTHPFLTLQFLTDGRVRPARPRCSSRRAATRSTWWPPTTSSPSCCEGWCRPTCSTSWRGTGCTSTSRARSGVVFHMISCLTEHGRVGLTAVGDTPAEADRRYRDASRILLEEARLAFAERPLPV